MFSLVAVTRAGILPVHTRIGVQFLVLCWREPFQLVDVDAEQEVATFLRVVLGRSSGSQRRKCGNAEEDLGWMHDADAVDVEDRNDLWFDLKRV